VAPSSTRPQVNVFGPPESGKKHCSILCRSRRKLFSKAARYSSSISTTTGHQPRSPIPNFGIISADTLQQRRKIQVPAPEDAKPKCSPSSRTPKHEGTFASAHLDPSANYSPCSGANSTTPDDYTRVHRAAITPSPSLAPQYFAIDHEAKGTDSRSMAAAVPQPKRAIDGVMFCFTVSKMPLFYLR